LDATEQGGENRTEAIQAVKLLLDELFTGHSSKRMEEGGD
jgi:hypothetical protein